MRIRKLHLHNFRNFSDRTFEFPDLFTVVIGDNGKGKSTILQGLRLAAATFLLGLDEAERIHIRKEDIRRIESIKRFAPQSNCFFEADGTLDKKTISWKRTLVRENGRTDIKDAAAIINAAKSKNDLVNKQLEEGIDLPVLCYFSTGRLWAESKQTIQLKKKGSRLKDGYARCLDFKTDKTSPLSWIKSTFYKKLKGREESVLLDAVFEAISTCVPGWTALEWDEDYDDLFGLYKGEDGVSVQIPLYYLSDGQRTMAGMAAEIAYRCVVLNPHYGREAVKKSSGIVLIDEIDLHLHPTWQKSIVELLKAAFPSLQFVVTTHSPFIIQSLRCEELINLDRFTDIHPKSLSLEEVAENVMGVPSPFALDNDREAEAAAAYLDQLKPTVATRGIDSQSRDPNTENLEELEGKISDPALRALLQMKRLENQIKP